MTKKINWLNHIAEDWDKARIKDCIKKDIYNKNKKDEEDITFLPMTKVSSLGDFDSKNIKKAKDYLSGFTYFEKNDVLLAKITPCFENKKSAVLKSLETEKGYGSTEFHVFRTNHKLLNDYLYYIFNLDSFIDIGVANFKGSAGHKRVPYEIIESLEIPLPKKSEQEIIIKYLNNKTSKIDSAVAELEKQKSLLIELKKSTIHEAVTKGLDLTVNMVAKNNRLKDSIYVISSGLNEFDGVKNYLSTKSIGEQGIKQIEAEVSFEKRPSRANMQPQINSLWTAYMQGSKKFLFVDDFDICKNYIISTGMFGFKVKNGNNPEYFSYLLQSNIIENQKNRRVKGTTQISVNDSDFKNMIINLPDKNEQDKIVFYLNKKTEQIYKSIKAIDEQVNKMKEYKKTLINDVVTGKIKVV